MAFNKLNKFALAPYKPDFPQPKAFPDWKTLELRNVVFHYQDNAFSVGPINLTIHRGELLFLIGGNGSGKSTLAMLLTGLYQPQSGTILLDGQPIAAGQRKIIANCFLRCSPMCGYSTACWGRRGNPPIPRWSKSGLST